MIDATEVATMPDVYWAWIRMQRLCMLRGNIWKCNSNPHVKANKAVSENKRGVTQKMKVAEFEMRHL